MPHSGPCWAELVAATFQGGGDVGLSSLVSNLENRSLSKIQISKLLKRQVCTSFNIPSNLVRLTWEHPRGAAWCAVDVTLLELESVGDEQCIGCGLAAPDLHLGEYWGAECSLCGCQQICPECLYEWTWPPTCVGDGLGDIYMRWGWIQRGALLCVVCLYENPKLADAPCTAPWCQHVVLVTPYYDQGVQVDM